LAIQRKTKEDQQIMDCESWEFEKRTSEWVLCTPVRVLLEMLIDRYSECRCPTGPNPFCRCKIKPWPPECQAALLAALTGGEYNPDHIAMCLNLQIDFNPSERATLAEIVRHGRMVQVFEESQHAKV
jgi:hypothetical protein